MIALAFEHYEEFRSNDQFDFSAQQIMQGDMWRSTGVLSLLCCSIPVLVLPYTPIIAH